ncbi:hypothetical protein [Dechloromonas sp. A34]|uniref:hypothetical protein n=1 Tax=Dechloromonas sp. A34 TaxID=447588 RepID=UPI002248E61D|nr:hypothetical protein [Dechloromonas sp. A34]
MRIRIRITTLFLPGAPPIMVIARAPQPAKIGRSTARPFLPPQSLPASRQI